MKSPSVAVLVRVHQRTQDLKVCLEVIRKYWKTYDYHVVVVSNGVKNGYEISDEIRALADKVIELEPLEHISGSSQLLLEGLEFIPDQFKYAVLLEADTWVFSDKLIAQYIRLMQAQKAVWASAEWIKKVHSLALDFAVVETRFLKNNPNIFKFKKMPESFVCNYLRSCRGRYLFISECMPVHFPKFMRLFYDSKTGRMHSFSRAQMVTHHLEDLDGEMEEKKNLANIAAGFKAFNTGQTPSDIRAGRLRLKLVELAMKIMPQSRWIKPKKTQGMD